LNSDDSEHHGINLAYAQNTGLESSFHASLYLEDAQKYNLVEGTFCAEVSFDIQSDGKNHRIHHSLYLYRGQNDSISGTSVGEDNYILGHSPLSSLFCHVYIYLAYSSNRKALAAVVLLQ
jgi:hypothetical protein